MRGEVLLTTIMLAQVPSGSSNLPHIPLCHSEPGWLGCLKEVEKSRRSSGQVHALCRKIAGLVGTDGRLIRAVFLLASSAPRAALREGLKLRQGRPLASSSKYQLSVKGSVSILPLYPLLVSTHAAFALFAVNARKFFAHAATGTERRVTMSGSPSTGSGSPSLSRLSI